jgi:predicted N-acyltransferase
MLFKICVELKDKIYNKKDLIGMLIKDCPIILNKKSSFCDPFVTFDKDVTMVLNLNKSWTCIDDYCNDLTRKYKQRFKKIKKSAESLTIKPLNLDEIIKYSDKMESLYLELVNKQMITLGTLNSSYFVNMKKVLNERFECFGFFKDDELVAFSSHIYYPLKNEMEIHYIGINGQLNNQYQLYFNILCHGVETAINKQYNTLELGRTAKEAKANMGAVAQVNQSYVWLSNRILRSIFKYMSSHTEQTTTLRQPFKQQKVNEEMVEHQVLD